MILISVLKNNSIVTVYIIFDKMFLNYFGLIKIKRIRLERTLK